MTGNITTKELTCLEDQLDSELTLVKKYQAYAELCTDATLKGKMSAMADVHQKHFDTLMRYLG